jgi:endonuclease/exonuclease/phosphatase (EEP) superfamily protein YafD
VPGRPWARLADLVALLDELTPWLFLPLPLWLLTLAAARTRAALFASALPWALFLALYGELFVPRPAHLAAWLGPGPPPETRLRVMTFNVLGTERPTEGLVRVIARADPDVLLTQELLPGLARGIDGALGDRYPYSRLRTDGLWGAQGIWSRYPIVAEERWDGSRRGANWQHAVLDVGGRPVHLVNLHLTTPGIDVRAGDVLPAGVPVGEAAAARRQEVAGLAPRLRALAAGGAPVIVAGDLNLTDQTPEFRRLLEAGYANGYRQAGWGIDLTYPALPGVRVAGGVALVRFPLIGIDHVLLSAGARAGRATVWPDGGTSDHRPVVVDVVLRFAGCRRSGATRRAASGPGTAVAADPETVTSAAVEVAPDDERPPRRPAWRRQTAPASCVRSRSPDARSSAARPRWRSVRRAEEAAEPCRRAARARPGSSLASCASPGGVGP